MRTFEEEVRRRVWNTLEPSVLAQAAMTVANGQQFIAGCYQPSHAQLVQLAQRFGTPVPPAATRKAA